MCSGWDLLSLQGKILESMSYYFYAINCVVPPIPPPISDPVPTFASLLPAFPKEKWEKGKTRLPHSSSQDPASHGSDRSQMPPNHKLALRHPAFPNVTNTWRREKQRVYSERMRGASSHCNTLKGPKVSAFALGLLAAAG